LQKTKVKETKAVVISRAETLLALAHGASSFDLVYPNQQIIRAPVEARKKIKIKK
jgi:hypothetical protein